LQVNASNSNHAPDFNPYEVLGIRKWATLKELERAYFNLVKKYNPEIFPEQFIEIRKAYDILRVAKKRAQTDILLYNEIPGGIGFKGIEVKTESVVKLNKEIKDLEAQGMERSAADRAALLDLLRKRSLIYVNKNYWHEAITDWKRILTMDQEDRQAARNIIQGYSRLGFSYAQNGFNKKAIEAWQEILKLKPGCLEAVHNIAIAATRESDAAMEKEYWEKTLEIWADMLNKNDNDDYLKNLIVATHNHFGGRFITKKKAVTPAVSKQQEVLGQIGGFSENLQLGMACINNQNWAQAIEAFEKCLSEQPENIEVLNALGWAYLNSNQANKAFSTWKKALKIDPRNQSALSNMVQGHLSVARSLRTQKAFGPALVHLKSVLKLMPDQPEVFMEIGNTYLMKQDYQSAIENWEKVVELDPKNRLAQQAIREARNRIRGS
jgi:tetratricopeptide (TPR) repeat protein